MTGRIHPPGALEGGIRSRSGTARESAPTILSPFARGAACVTFPGPHDTLARDARARLRARHRAPAGRRRARRARAPGERALPRAAGARRRRAGAAAEPARASRSIPSSRSRCSWRRSCSTPPSTPRRATCGATGARSPASRWGPSAHRRRRGAGRALAGARACRGRRRSRSAPSWRRPTRRPRRRCSSSSARRTASSSSSRARACSTTRARCSSTAWRWRGGHRRCRRAGAAVPMLLAVAVGQRRAGRGAVRAGRGLRHAAHHRRGHRRDRPVLQHVRGLDARRAAAPLGHPHGGRVRDATWRGAPPSSSRRGSGSRATRCGRSWCSC